jgi:membrane protein
MGSRRRGRLSWKSLFQNLYREYERDDVSGSAAVLSYYFVYSLFPFMFFLATLAAYIPGVHDSVGTLLANAHNLLPPQALKIIEGQVRELVDRPRPHLLTIGIVFTLYAASRGVDAVRKALNLAYDVKESRAFWKTELLAFAMTIGGAGLVLLGIAALVTGGEMGLWLAGRLRVAHEYVLLWSWARWPVTAFLIMLCAAVGYYVLPDVEQKFKFITPGSIIGTLIWLVATWGFDQYAAHFSSYNVTYGSIGGVIVLMTWFYISGFIFLMGGELNAVLEHASADGKAAGARSPDETPPPPEERPSAMPPGAVQRASVAAETPGGADGSSERH